MQRILILGGSGFVGRALCEQLQADSAFAGARLVVPTRKRSRAKALLTQPQVDVVEGNIHEPATLLRLLEGCDAVVNLVAILHGTPAEFESVHVTAVRRLVEACQRAKVERLVHVSALGVPDEAARAPSHYLRTKALGELVLREAAQAGLSTAILRPSVIFGADDKFLNLFATLQTLAPMVPLAGSDAQFQPVWVEDVAKALVSLLKTGQTGTFEAAGPQVFSLGELVRLAGQWSGRSRPVFGVPMSVGRLQAALMACLPGEPLMSADNLDSMSVPNVASGAVPGLEALGLSPTALEAVAPNYLSDRASWARQLDAWRGLAKR